MAVTEQAAPAAPAVQPESGMLESVHVRNFRGLKDLEIKGLGRINLFAGRNNSGKTALLEALSLLAGAGWPDLAFNPLIVRGAEVLVESATVPGIQVSGAGVRESLWKPMFHGLDLRKKITVAAEHVELGELLLDVDFARHKNVEINVGNLGSKSVASLQDTLGFAFHGEPTGNVTSQAFLNEQGRKTTIYTGDTDPDPKPSFPAVYLAGHGVSHLQDARNLGEVRRQKQGDLVVQALKIIDPRLESIEDNSASGVPMIWGDIGSPELMPLLAMGAGLGRASRLFIGMLHVKGGAVIVDEIENGFHYLVVPRLWEAIDRMARDFDVQIFATTHSRECVRAGVQGAWRRRVRLPSVACR